MISDTEKIIGAISGALAIFGTILTIFWNYLQSKRLRFEKDMHRESHNMSLFEALSSDNPQLQLAAAAVLAERLFLNSRKPDNSEKINVESENRTIINALIAVTKNLGTAPIREEVSKFVADTVVKGAHGFPLKQFDWQNTRLTGAWWKGVDASEVDFWRADLSRVGMRNANLQSSVLVEANLDHSVLAGADLTNANLTRASLLGTDFFGAKLEGAIFAEAKYNNRTRFPDGFDVETKGLIKDREEEQNIDKTTAALYVTA